MNKTLKFLVWLFPLAAIVISAYLAQKFFKERGPEVTIEFDDAGSIEPNKTKVIYRGIAVGRVDRTRLNTEGTKAIAVVQMSAGTEDLLRENTRFLIVQPEVSMEGVSGLETLVKGPIIRIEPGKGDATSHFVGIETSEVGAARDSVIYHLTMAHADSLGPGDPIYFRGTKIGAVAEARLSKDARGVVLDLSISKQYVRVIRTNSVFWRKSAVQADLGLFGSNIEIGSLETMMKGGVNVATPPGAGKIADAGETFTLRAKEPEDWREWSPVLTF